MVEYEIAIQTILSNATLLKSESVELKNALGRVLKTSVFYDIAMPPFNKSAMDGFACRKQDLGNELEMIETVWAGKKPEKIIGLNQCAKIMTGAVVPEGANVVVMKEYSTEKDGRVNFSITKSKSNICGIGEDVQVGDLALASNTLLSSRHIPVLAGAGAARPEVYGQPRVSVFATGSELVEPSKKPKSFQIRNSNSAQMMAQLQELRIDGDYRGIISDNFDETKAKIEAAFEDHDIVILSGGVSEGDFDFIPTVIKELGFEILLTRIAVQPGKPIIFARNENKYCFGLAGNPASSFVQFELYLKPFIYKMMGYNYKSKVVQATLTSDYSRRKTDRLKFIPAFLNNDLSLSQIEYHGSAHINALINANCLLMVPIGVSEIKKGEEVDVRQF